MTNTAQREKKENERVQEKREKRSINNHILKSKDSSDTIPFFVTSSKENFWGTKPWQTIDTYVHHEEALPLENMMVKNVFLQFQAEAY